jgi:phage FluMu protein gp41
MNTSNPSNPAQAHDATVQDLFHLVLADGLPAERDGKSIRYKVAKLRETTVADERFAAQKAERVVFVQGQPKLLASDSEYRFALTMRHVDKLVCPGIGELDQSVIDLDVFSKLTAYDVGLIERRIFLIEAAAQIRYGLITQQQFDDMRQQLAGDSTPPQPAGPVAVSGAPASEPGPGPAMLADFSGDSTRLAPHGVGG